MLNYETLLSSYDDKLTLMQWLKKVEAALKDASAVSFNVNKRGDATLTFSVVFEDGSEIESNAITLQQGESVASAYISNGNLHLVLTNGDDLDAGNMFDGDVTLTGNLTAAGIQATGTGVKTSVIQQNDNSGIDFFASEVTFNNDVSAQGTISANILKQEAYEYSRSIAFSTNVATINNKYCVLGVINNVLHIVANFEVSNDTSGNITLGNGYGNIGLVSFSIDPQIAAKIIDFDNIPLSQAGAASRIIADVPCDILKKSISLDDTEFLEGRFTLARGSSLNTAVLNVALNGKTTDRYVLPSGEKLYVSARLSLTLL